MANLPPFPINYPYKAHHDHDARGRADCLSLEKGDEGKVLQISGKNICVTLPRLGLDVCGWVPEGVIDIGTTRPAGDIVYSTDLPNIIDATNAESFDIEQPHLFGKTTAAYMIGLKNAQEKLSMMPKWVGPFVNTQESCTQTVGNIVAGTEKAGLLDSFNFYGVSIDSIIARGSKITPTTKKDFSYSLIYVIILKFLAREPEVYIGKTVDGARRYDGHMASKKDGTTAKDAAHRASSEMHMIPICVLDAAADDDHLRLIAEQYFMNLFGSYFGKILVFHNDDEPANFQRDSAAPGQKVQTPEDEGTAFISRWYNDCMHAYMFRKFAAGVFEEVEWTPLCQREGFGASKGLNWQSPLGAESTEKIIWTAMESEKFAFTDYTRRPKPATRSKRGSLTVLSIAAPKNLEIFQLNVAEKESGPSLGDQVTVLFEVMHGGKPHKKPWARLPQICRFPDVDLANSLGVMITWVDKAGKYWEKYVQSRGAIIARDDNIPGSLANYGSATGIIRYLQREKLVNEEGFDSDLGLARVKQVTYHHLKQLIDIRDRDFGSEHGILREVTKPKMRSLRDVGDMMFRLGAHNIDGPWRVFKEGTGREDGREQACDSCFVLKVRNSTFTCCDMND
jgi:hypothetical protein